MDLSSLCATEPTHEQRIASSLSTGKGVYTKVSQTQNLSPMMTRKRWWRKTHCQSTFLLTFSASWRPCAAPAEMAVDGLFHVHARDANTHIYTWSELRGIAKKWAWAASHTEKVTHSPPG